MNNTESDLFVHGLRSLMTQIGKERTCNIQLLLTWECPMCICELSTLSLLCPASISACAHHCSNWRCRLGRWTGAGLGLWPPHCWWVTSERSSVSPEVNESPSCSSASHFYLQVMVMGNERGYLVLFKAVTNSVTLDQWLSLNRRVASTQGPFL